MFVNGNKSKIFKEISQTVRPYNVNVSTRLLAIILMLGGGQYSFAQEARVSGLEEVIVTASRREEGLQSIAASITTMTGRELEKQGITGFKEMAEAVSGLELKQSRGSLSSAMYIRGVGTSGSTPADPSVGVLVDGVYQATIGAAFTELMDIQRIEVLRGPQGTLFGKNTTAGVIRIITEKPNTHEFSGHLQGVVGNLDNQEARGLVNIPLLNGRLGARLSGYTSERDGHTKNLYAGEDTRNIDRHGWRGKLLWHASDTLDVQFSAERHKQKSRMESALVEYPPDLLAQFGDSLPPISIGRYQQNPEKTWGDIKRYILKVDWDLFDHTLSLTSSFENLKDFLNQDQDFTILGGQELGNYALTFLDAYTDRDVTTHELQLSSNFEGAFNYILGGFWQNNDRVSLVDIYLGDGGPVPASHSERDYTSQAIFGNVTYEFNDHWSASLGARYTDDEQAGSNNLFDGKTTFEEWTYSLKLSYHYDDDRMVYFAHDKGFKSGGINREINTCGRGGLCLTPDQIFWDPETTFNYEIGIKSEWLDNRLRFNAALFHQIYEDFQINQVLAGSASVLLTNAAKVKSQGVEADFAWIATSNLTLSGNMAYLETKYEDYKNAPCALPTSPGCANGAQNLSGKTLDNAPKLTYSVAAEYRSAINIQSYAEWFGRLDVSFKDSFYLHDTRAAETRQNRYHLLNARIGLESPENWRLTLWGKNLANENYLVEAEFSELGLQKIPGLPRTYGVTLDWYF